MGIRVDTSFPGGNAGDILVNETETPPVVSFAADPHGGPEALWFDLRVAMDPPIPAIKLVLKHFQTFMTTAHRCVGLSFETPYALCRGTVMTREDYRTVGARIALAVMALATKTPKK